MTASLIATVPSSCLRLTGSRPRKGSPSNVSRQRLWCFGSGASVYTAARRACATGGRATVFGRARVGRWLSPSRVDQQPRGEGRGGGGRRYQDGQRFAARAPARAQPPLGLAPEEEVREREAQRGEGEAVESVREQLRQSPRRGVQVRGRPEAV